MAIEPIKNGIRSSQQFRGEEREIRWCSGMQFYKCGRKCNEPAAHSCSRVYDATRRDATQRDGTGPTTRSIETTRLDELVADQLLSRMLIIVLEAFRGELYMTDAEA